MPDPARPSLVLVADLVLEVGDDRGSTTAYLTNDDTGLVLDVRDPATLLRCVPPRGPRRDLVRSSPATRFAGIPVRVTSRGRDLGRVRLTTAGKVHARASLSGTPTLVRTAASYASARLGRYLARWRATPAGRRST
ncbi:MAG TPA: hypothetical protein VIG79_12735 [Lapillicoccus sp.]|uniref:hypothetical protein n=1 Tax=Lapillicoccus sp. TaxID=1909287 RepID=UPI002F95E73D